MFKSDRKGPPRPPKFSGHVPVAAGTSELDLERRPVDIPKVASSIRVSTMPFKWFTLAPVYFFTPLSFSLVDQFAQTPAGKDISCFVYNLEFPIVSIPGWSHTIKGLEPEAWEDFTKFVSTCGFYAPKHPDEIITVRHQVIKMKDKKTFDNKTFKLTVFLPDKKKLKLVPKLEKDVLSFTFEKPQQLEKL